jgi:hypothetical protein
MSPSNSTATPLQALISGSFAGSVSAFAGAPFDYVKVRLQTQANASAFQIVSQSLREKGVYRLFSGTTPALIVAVLENSVVFAANAGLTRTWRSISQKEEETLFETAVLGGLSGIFSAAAISPAETVKVRLQRGGYTGPRQCLQRIIAEEGASALFRGLPAQLPRDILFNFFFFSAFDACCRTAANVRGVDKNKIGVFDLVLAGGVAGATGWTFTLPFDVVKSRTQAMKAKNGENSLQFAKRVTYGVFHESGVKGFFRGWSAAVARAFPVNGVLFACYSLTERALESVH